MNTAIKIHVAAGDSVTLEKTEGVREPSDLKHYPPLHSGASPNASSAANHLSRSSTSFRDTLAMDDGVASSEATTGAVKPNTEASAAQSGHISTDKARGTLAVNSLPTGVEKISVQEDGRSDEPAKQRDNSQDDWQPVSPRKHVTQQRLTTDADANKEANKNTVYNIPAHSNPFEVLSEAPVHQSTTHGTRQERALVPVNDIFDRLYWIAGVFCGVTQGLWRVLHS